MRNILLTEEQLKYIIKNSLLNEKIIKTYNFPDSFGTDYMGSKSIYAFKILSLICKLSPNSNILYDLFGGGGAISDCALWCTQNNIGNFNFKKVHYNDISRHVTQILNKNFDYKNISFLPKEEYETRLKNGDNHLVLYMGSPRLKDMTYYNSNKDSFKKQFNRNSKFIERMRGYGDALTYSNNPYNELNIPQNAIKYCDIPYKDTKNYELGNSNKIEFDHNMFYEWALKQDNIYISEYSMPDEFQEILSISKGDKQEKLFMPKKNLPRNWKEIIEQYKEPLQTSMW